MEKDTVLLDIEKYNELRDFKENILKGNCYVLPVQIHNNNWNNFNYNSSCFFKDEKTVIGDFENKNKELLKKIDELNDIINDKKNVTLNIEFSKTELKKMSYWKFRKIKKQL